MIRIRVKGYSLSRFYGFLHFYRQPIYTMFQCADFLMQRINSFYNALYTADLRCVLRIGAEVRVNQKCATAEASCSKCKREVFVYHGTLLVNAA